MSNVKQGKTHQLLTRSCFATSQCPYLSHSQPRNTAEAIQTSQIAFQDLLRAPRGVLRSFSAIRKSAKTSLWDPSRSPQKGSQSKAPRVATKMARSSHPGRALEALKRYKFQGFSNFSKPKFPPGLGLLGTILGPDLVPVYMYMTRDVHINQRTESDSHGSLKAQGHLLPPLALEPLERLAINC